MADDETTRMPGASLERVRDRARNTHAKDRLRALVNRLLKPYFQTRDQGHAEAGSSRGSGAEDREGYDDVHRESHLERIQIGLRGEVKSTTVIQSEATYGSPFLFQVNSG